MFSHHSALRGPDFRVCGISGRLTRVGRDVRGAGVAAIELRVEGRPSTGPIEAYVKVTDANGDPVPSLDENDFTILIDGDPITIAADDVTLPPSLDPNQRVSVVFVHGLQRERREPVSRPDAERGQGVHRRNGRRRPCCRRQVQRSNPGAISSRAIHRIDDGGANDVRLERRRGLGYPGNGTNMADALLIALEHLATPRPAPFRMVRRPIILVGDGSNSESQRASKM